MNSLAALLLVALLPAPQSPSPQRSSVDAAAVRKVGDRLRALQVADPELLKAIEKLLRDNPKLNPEQLAEKFLAERPELARPENLAKLPKVLETIAESLPAPPTPDPAGGPPATAPNTPPVTPPPKPPDPVELPGGGPVPTPVPDPPLSPNPGGGDPVPPGGQPGMPPEVPPVVPPVKPPEMPPALPPELPPVPENVTPPTEAPAPVPPPQTEPPAPPPASPEDANFRAAKGWWEQNVGPLEDTPAVRDLLEEMIKGGGGADGKSPLSEFLKDVKGEVPGGFKGWLKDNLPKDVKLSDFGLGGKVPTMPSAPVLPSVAPTAPSVALGDSWPLLAVLAAIAVLAAGYFLLGSKWRDRLAAGRPTPVPGLGPWPIDPRNIATPADLVLAFDYLSVLTIGAGARQYSHLTIAGELRQLVPDAAAAADELGRHYETARYAPSGMVAPEDFAAARAALCELAGVPA